MDNTESIVLDAIYARRSIRVFDEAREVEREKIVKLLKAAMAAPSACNIQPWDFVVITDKEMIMKIRGIAQQVGNYNTSVIIVICGNNEFIPWKDGGVIDCAAAMENMMIAAPAMGLGTVCIGGFDRKAAKELLGIPEGCEPIVMVYVGYPKGEKAPRTKYLEEAVHWERYDAQRERKARPGNILVYGVGASM